MTLILDKLYYTVMYRMSGIFNLEKENNRSVNYKYFLGQQRGKS